MNCPHCGEEMFREGERWFCVARFDGKHPRVAGLGMMIELTTEEVGAAAKRAGFIEPVRTRIGPRRRALGDVARRR